MEEKKKFRVSSLAAGQELLSPPKNFLHPHTVVTSTRFAFKQPISFQPNINYHQVKMYLKNRKENKAGYQKRNKYDKQVNTKTRNSVFFFQSAPQEFKYLYLNQPFQFNMN